MSVLCQLLVTLFIWVCQGTDIKGVPTLVTITRDELSDNPAEMPLQTRPCVILGVTYSSSQFIYTDACNVCQCDDGLIDCQRQPWCSKEPANRPDNRCYFKGKWYQNGQIMDKEGRCLCLSGMRACV